MSEPDKHREIKIIREVQNYAELFYPKAVELGMHAADAISRRNRSQLTNLETLAESAYKTADIFDYVKRQTARHEMWRKKQNDVAFGESLRAYLENDLKKTRDAICDKLEIGAQTDEDQLVQRRIYLQLIRQFVRHMVITYEYQVSLAQATGPGQNRR